MKRERERKSRHRDRDLGERVEEENGRAEMGKIKMRSMLQTKRFGLKAYL